MVGKSQAPKNTERTDVTATNEDQPVPPPLSTEERGLPKPAGYTEVRSAAATPDTRIDVEEVPLSDQEGQGVITTPAPTDSSGSGESGSSTGKQR